MCHTMVIVLRYERYERRDGSAGGYKVNSQFPRLQTKAKQNETFKHYFPIKGRKPLKSRTVRCRFV